MHSFLGGTCLSGLCNDDGLCVLRALRSMLLLMHTLRLRACRWSVFDRSGFCSGLASGVRLALQLCKTWCCNHFVSHRQHRPVPSSRVRPPSRVRVRRIVRWKNNPTLRAAQDTLCGLSAATTHIPVCSCGLFSSVGCAISSRQRPAKRRQAESSFPASTHGRLSLLLERPTATVVTMASSQRFSRLLLVILCESALLSSRGAAPTNDSSLALHLMLRLGGSPETRMQGCLAARMSRQTMLKRIEQQISSQHSAFSRDLHVAARLAAHRKAAAQQPLATAASAGG